MFQNINFVKNNKNTSIKSLSIQEQYVLYKFFLKLDNSKIGFTFKGFFISLKIFNKNFKHLGDLKTFLLILLLFLNKTNNLFYLKKLNNSNTYMLFGNSYLNYFPTNTNKNSFNRFSIFWKRWKNLKRPKTSLNFNEYFISTWSNKISKYTKIGLIAPKYSSSSINKLVDANTLSNFEFQYLRKNKVYNKGRYSRCRQNYRTGVYMCMYLSVVSIFGLYYWFYKFSFNFTYLWWLFIAFLGSFFLPKIIKYRLYEPTTLINKIFDFLKWVFLLFKTLFF